MATTRQRGTTAITPTIVATLAVLAGIAAFLYGVGVLLPYYANGLHRFPLSEVAGGAHDPKDLWPQGPANGITQIAGFLSLLLVPLLLVTSGLASGFLLLYGLFARTERVARRAVLALLGVFAVCLAGLVHFFSPVGLALTSWRLD